MLEATASHSACLAWAHQSQPWLYASMRWSYWGDKWLSWMSSARTEEKREGDQEWHGHFTWPCNRILVSHIWPSCILVSPSAIHLLYLLFGRSMWQKLLLFPGSIFSYVTYRTYCFSFRSWLEVIRHSVWGTRLASPQNAVLLGNDRM